jgi:hypothetical protein
MRATRRRQRMLDSFARPETVRVVCEELRSRMPGVIPNPERQLVKFLNAVRHVERRPASDTKRGRPPRWGREVLVNAAARLRAVLERETQGRVSLNSFIGQYLPVLYMSRDIQEPLGCGDINLFEAHQLSRLTAKRLGCTDGEARSHRRNLMQAHLLRQESGPRLRERVKEALGELREPDPVEAEAAAVIKSDALLEADPLDASHIFFEDLRMISRALREIDPGEVTDEDLSEIMPAVDHIALTLQKMARRKERERAKRLVI